MAARSSIDLERFHELPVSAKRQVLASFPMNTPCSLPICSPISWKRAPWRSLDRFTPTHHVHTTANEGCVASVDQARHSGVFGDKPG